MSSYIGSQASQYHVSHGLTDAVSACFLTGTLGTLGLYWIRPTALKPGTKILNETTKRLSKGLPVVLNRFISFAVFGGLNWWHVLHSIIVFANSACDITHLGVLSHWSLWTEKDLRRSAQDCSWDLFLWSLKWNIKTCINTNAMRMTNRCGLSARLLAVSSSVQLTLL